MAGPTEDQRFYPSRDHHPLPDRLSRFNIFEFPNMVDLKGTLLRFTVFALPRIQTVDEFRPAERKHERVWRRVHGSPARSRVSEVFETEEAENARPVLFRPGHDGPLLRFVLAGRFLIALSIVVDPRFGE